LGSFSRSGGDPVIERMGIQGEAVLVLDTCQSGAFIGQFAPNVSYSPIHVSTPKAWLAAHPNISVITAQWGGLPASYYSGKIDGTQYEIEYLTYGLSHAMGWTMFLQDPANTDDEMTIADLFSYTKVKAEEWLAQNRYKTNHYVAGYRTNAAIPSSWSQKVQIHLGDNASSVVIF